MTWWRRPARAAVAEDRTLGEALLDRLDAGRLAEAGVTPEQVTAALDPAGYLGAATSSWTRPWPRTPRPPARLPGRPRQPLRGP